MKILFIYNPHSGQKRLDKKELYLDYIRNSEDHCVFFETRPSYGGYDYLMESDQVYDIIVGIGGDGTISKIMDAMIKRNLKSKLLIIPQGSTNEYAQSLGLSNHIEENLDLIKNGQVRKVDVGKMNDKHFAYVAAFGNFTAASYDTPQKWKNVIGHSAYWLYGAIKLNTIRNYHYRISFNNKTYDQVFLFGLISNAFQFGRIFKYPHEEISLEDGLFEVLLIQKPDTIMDYIKLLQHILIQDYTHPLFITAKVSEITLESTHRSYTWNLDGENGGKQEITKIEVIKEAIEVLVPSNEIL